MHLSKEIMRLFVLSILFFLVLMTSCGQQAPTASEVSSPGLPSVIATDTPTKPTSTSTITPTIEKVEESPPPEPTDTEQQTLLNAFIYIEDYGDFEPKWSPDGSRILFTSDRDGDLDIYLMDADGSNIINLTPDSDRVLSSLLLLTEKSRDISPAWSSEGDFIVFASSRDNNMHTYTEFELYVMNSDGSQVVKLTDTRGFGFFPSWSPDGERVVFLSKDGTHPNLFTVKVDGSDVAQLTFQESNKDSPNWSPDGDEIVFASNHEGDAEIYVIDKDGSNLRRLTIDPGEDFNPSWSPDGKQIAFVSDRDGDEEIYVMDIDGTNVIQLTHNDKEEYEPAWSPDGTQIAFRSNREGGWHIFLMDRDGTNLVQITGHPVKVSPIEDAEDYLNLGLAQFLTVGESGEFNYEFVIESFSKAILMDPQMEEAYLGRGLAYLFRCEVIWYYLMLSGGDALQEKIDACVDLDKAISHLETSLDLGLDPTLSADTESLVELLK